MTGKEVSVAIRDNGGACPYVAPGIVMACSVCPCLGYVTEAGCGRSDSPDNRAKRVELCEAYLASLEPDPTPKPEVLSLRDYIAAHAPPVPNYYRLRHPDPIPREPDGYYDSMSPCTQSERDAYIDKREAIVTRNELERVLSWPWFYADGVLERRGK